MVSLFGKRAPKTSAAERVRILSAQGESEPEIIRELKIEGYSPKDVDAAMKEAVKAAVSPRLPTREELGIERPTPVRPAGLELPGARPARLEELPEERPARPEWMPPVEERPVPRPYEMPERPSEYPEFLRPRAMPPERMARPAEEEEEISLPPRARAPMERRGEIEEIAESVIAERWETFEREIDSMNKRVSELSARINAMESMLREVGGVKKSDISDIKTAIDTYRQTISDMIGRMESVENAVKDSLGPMLQTLRAMSDTIKALKAK